MDHPASPPPPLPPDAIAALHLGRKIEAIKIVREVEHLGLKEAKDRVDLYVEHDPHLREKVAGGPSSFLPCGCVLVLILMFLVGLAAFLYFRPRG